MDKQEQQAAEEALVLMPRSVRTKLDKVGIKLHLSEWQRLPLSDRERLRDEDCEHADQVRKYREDLHAMVEEHCGKKPDTLA